MPPNSCFFKTFSSYNPFLAFPPSYHTWITVILSQVTTIYFICRCLEIFQRCFLDDFSLRTSSYFFFLFKSNQFKLLIKTYYLLIKIQGNPFSFLSSSEPVQIHYCLYFYSQPHPMTNVEWSLQLTILPLQIFSFLCIPEASCVLALGKGWWEILFYNVALTIADFKLPM